MAIAFNQAAYTFGGGTDLNAATLALTTSGSNLLIFVGIGVQDAGSVSAVAYNGVSGVLIDTVTTGGAGNFYLWYIAGPTSGAFNVEVTASNNGNWQLGAVAYTGARASTVPDAHGTNNPGAGNSSVTNTLTSVSDNCWHVMYGTTSVNDARTVSAGASTTLRTTASRTSGFFDGNAAITPPGSNGITFNLSSSGAPVALGATFAPIFTGTFTDSIALTEGTILRSRFVSDTISLVTVYLQTFTDSLGLTEVVTLFTGWVTSIKNSSIWNNQDKS